MKPTSAPRPHPEAAHPTAARIRVALVDDHRIVREGIRRILAVAPEIEVVGEAENGHEALSLIRRTSPAVVLLDLNLAGVSGMNLVRRVRQEQPRTAILVLSMHGEEQYAMRALKAGAQGYLTKDAAAEELVMAVRKVATGGCHLSRAMAERVAMSLVQREDGPRHRLLSDREFEVFRLIVSGRRMTDIAEAMHLSIKTVSTHKSRLLQKMQLDSTAALIRYGLQHRLFSDGGHEEEVHPGHGQDPSRSLVASRSERASRSPAHGVQTVMEF